MAQIIPSILVYSKEEFLEQIAAISPVCSFVQIDIADGVFVENTTWGNAAIVAKHMPIDFELHLMVHNPLEIAEIWSTQSHLKRLIVHFESLKNPKEDLQTLRSYQKELCLCLNPETPVSAIDPLVDLIDSVQLMTIHPGKQGQPFFPASPQRAEAIHAAHPHLPLAADGHMNEQTIPLMQSAGVSRFGVGSAIWHGNAQDNYRALTQLVHN